MSQERRDELHKIEENFVILDIKNNRISAFETLNEALSSAALLAIQNRRSYTVKDLATGEIHKSLEPWTNP